MKKKVKHQDNEEVTEGIEVQGHIDMRRNPVTHQKFLEHFIKFIESNDWDFGGGTLADNEREDI